MYMALVSFYGCCSDSVGACGNVCCVDSGFLAMGC